MPSAKPFVRLSAALSVARRYIPSVQPIHAARRLTVQANAARDARLYEVAAALFEEALRFTPGNGRIHLQCGHMFKEARDYASAEAHYHEARQLLPNSAEVALQLGHFYKVAGRTTEAAAAYQDALTLRPGWDEARQELSSVAVMVSIEDNLDGIIPELLPREQAGRHGPVAGMIRITRLGGGRVRSEGRTLKVVRGIEAIRGFIISSVPVGQIDLLIDEGLVRSETLASVPVEGAAARRKYAFNLWHDFGDVPPGRRSITLRFSLAKGKPRFHREHVLVVRPAAADELPHSDGFVPLAPGNNLDLIERVNSLPSVVRPAQRTPLPQPVRTILVQRVDQLGDLVCSVPAIRRIRALFPDARMVGLLTSANAELGRSLGLFDEIVVADYTESPAERRRTMPAESQAALRATLHAYNFDLAIDLGEGAASRLLLLLSGARYLYGFKERESPWLSAGIEMNGHDPVNGLENIPPSRKMLALVEGLAALHGSAAEPIRRTDLDPGVLRRYGVTSDRPFVVLHTGARLAYSRWPGFGALAALLLERTDLAVVILTDDPAEVPSLPQSDRVAVVEGKLPFDDFEALLAFCAVFVGNDSGPKHLASLRGAKVVSLHMARLNWNEWGQEISGSIISRRVPCAGCAISYDAEDCAKDFACIRHIHPDEVFQAVVDLL